MKRLFKPPMILVLFVVLALGPQPAGPGLSDGLQLQQ